MFNLFYIAAEKDIADNQTNCMTRLKMKRSASEMEMDPTYIVDEETYKRSKLAAALIQQPMRQQSRGSAGCSFSSLTTGATSITIRKEHQYQSSMGGCSTWEQQQQQPMMSPVIPSQALAMMQQKALPDLSKELSILMPVLSDCSGVNPANNNKSCCSVGSVSATSSVGCWKSGGSSDNPQSLPQSSFDSCDSGWMGTDDSYDLNTWKNLQNIRLNNNNNNNFENTVPPPSLHTPPNSSSGYFDATAAPDTSISSSEIYTPEDFTSANNTNSSSSVTATGSNYNTDFPLPLESSHSFPDANVKQDPCSSSSAWCESFIQQTQSFPQSQLQPQSKYQQSNMPNGRNGVCSTMPTESRVTAKDCPYDFDCYRLGGPFFRIQRPGNPTSVVVPSGRTSTLTTFCNMLPRTASYVQ